MHIMQKKQSRWVFVLYVRCILLCIENMIVFVSVVFEEKLNLGTIAITDEYEIAIVVVLLIIIMVEIVWLFVQLKMYRLCSYGTKSVSEVRGDWDTMTIIEI